MTWRTHLAVGVNALWVAPFFRPIDQSILILLPVAMLASLLPDIDATAAKIHFLGGGIFGIFRGAFYGKYFHHRGLMHSLPVTVLLFIILLVVFHNSVPALAYVFAASYFSHAVIDGFNTGVGYLYPFLYKRFGLIPKFLRTPVDGLLDRTLFLFAAFGILLFFLVFKNQFIPANLGIY